MHGPNYFEKNPGNSNDSIHSNAMSKSPCRSSFSPIGGFINAYNRINYSSLLNDPNFFKRGSVFENRNNNDPIEVRNQNQNKSLLNVKQQSSIQRRNSFMKNRVTLTVGGSGNENNMG